ncbi:MAG: DMT family transporter [Planctomycetes bacterium]|nr:DMT family transporter [Planctomycetota bacterium]
MSSVPKCSTPLFGYFLLVGSALLLAIYSESARALDRDLDWQSAAFARSLIGILIVVPMAWTKRSEMVVLHPKLFIRNLFVAIFLIGFVYSASKISPADVVTVMSTQPLWIAFISMYLFGIRYVKKFWFITAVFCIGVALLASAGSTDTVWVIVLFLILTMFRAVGTVMVLMLKEIPAIIQTVHLTMVMLLLSALIFFFYGGHAHLDTLLDAKGIALLLAIGFTGTLYQYFSVKVVQLLGSIAGGLMPVVAVVFAYVMDLILWQEGLNVPRFTGMVLVLSSVGWFIFSKHIQKSSGTMPA